MESMNTYQHKIALSHSEEAKTTHTVLVVIALIASVVFVSAWIFSGEESMEDYSLSNTPNPEVPTPLDSGALSSESVYATYKSTQ
jgi:hypothetical protein